jgi:hypothetical protein
MQKKSLFVFTGIFFFTINNFICSISSLSVNTSVFYYVWYGNPSTNGQWIKWTQNDHQPPDDIASNYYPILDPYASGNITIMNRHMEWLRSANVGIIIVSWWGPGSHEDLLIPDLLDAAANNGIKVAFHLEPYETRTAYTIKSDIQYILANYGSHPAVLKIVRPTKWGNSTSPRPIFYAYLSDRIDGRSWAKVLDSLRGTPWDVLLIAQSFNFLAIDTAHFDGIYTYDVYQINGSIFQEMSDGCKQRNSIFSASVGPGYIDIRARNDSNRIKSRLNGQTYDLMWQQALDAKTEWVSITSFNEWLEGTHIEPPVVKSTSQYNYMNFEGAYGKTGNEAQTAYLNRTAYWVQIFEK